MKKIFSITILLLFFAGFAFAQHGMMGKGMMKGMEGKMGLVQQVIMMTDYLSLSSEQLSKLTELDIDSQINLIKDRSAIQVAELELRKLMISYGADREVINTAIDILYDLKKVQRKNLINTHFEVISILTEEQFIKLNELRMTMGTMSGAMKSMGTEMEMMQPMMQQKEEAE